MNVMPTMLVTYWYRQNIHEYIHECYADNASDLLLSAYAFHFWSAPKVERDFRSSLHSQQLFLLYHCFFKTENISTHGMACTFYHLVNIQWVHC